MKLRHLLLPLACLWLAGCIVVEDFGTAWNEATEDPCLNTVTKALYDDEGATPLARALSVGDHHFLLLKDKPEEEGGNMVRFEVTEGIFTTYKLNPTMREAFTLEYPDAPVEVTQETVTLKNLGDPQRELLKKVANTPGYWLVDQKRMYNSLRDKTCIFGMPTYDEDTTKKDEKDGAKPK